MAVIYCTANQVASLLQVDNFSISTKPTQAQVEEFINRAEDYIDFQTMHAWRQRYSKSTTGADTSAPDYEYHSIEFDYKYQTGIPVFLEHRKIRSMDYSLGDRLEYFNGSNYEDWLQTKTEGRGNDWWVDYDNGILYLRAAYWVWRERPLTIRVKYRYGEVNVPKDIEEACVKLSAISVLQSEHRTALLTDVGTTNYLNYDRLIQMWKEDVEKILSARREVAVPHF